MNSPTHESRAEAVALARFSLIIRIQELVRTPVPLKVALDTVGSSAVLELEGQSQPVARRTLEDWWYAYQRGGFAALHPKARCDRGVPRALTAQQRAHIIEQVKACPAIPVKVRASSKSCSKTLPRVHPRPGSCWNGKSATS